MKKNKVSISVYFLLIIIIIIIIIGCQKSSTDLDKFFLKIDREITEEAKNKLKNCPDIKCVVDSIIFVNSYTELKQMFDNSPNSLNKILDSAGNNKHPRLALLIAYQRRITGKNFDFKDINKELIKYYNRQKTDLQQLVFEEMEKKNEIIETRFNKIKINDTVYFSFPIEEFEGGCNIIYRSPQKSDSIAKMIFIVLDKERVPKSKQYEFSNDEYILGLKYINSNHTNCSYLSKKLNIGDNIKIELFDYERDIKKEPRTSPYDK